MSGKEGLVRVPFAVSIMMIMIMIIVIMMMIMMKKNRVCPIIHPSKSDKTPLGP